MFEKMFLDYLYHKNDDITLSDIIELERMKTFDLLNMKFKFWFDFCKIYVILNISTKGG